MQQEQKSLYTALCAVQQKLKDWDTDILTDRERALNCLADLLPGDQKNRSRMRMFYESGAAGVLARRDLPDDQLCRRAVMAYVRYTDCVDSVAEEVVGAVARAMGIEPGAAPERTSAPPAMGKAGLPKVSEQLEQLQALAMLRDASSGEKKQRLIERVSEMMGELFCLLEDSRFMEEQERLIDRLDEVSGQEQEAIRARLRQTFRLVGEYGADVNLAANTGLTPREHLERLDPLSRASAEMSQLIIRQRTAPEEEKRRLEEQIGRKLDEVMALMEAGGETEEPAPKQRRAVPGTIVPAMCSRVHLTRRNMILKKAAQDQGLWDSWPEGQQLLEGKAKVATFETMIKLLSVCEKATQTDPDCMLLLSEWYSTGLSLDIGKFSAEGGVLPRDQRKSRYWEEKAAEAGHCIALFNQGLEALTAGDVDRAEELGQRSAQSRKGQVISDGHYLLALVELVRWKRTMDSGNVVLMLTDAKEHYKKAREELSQVFRMGWESRENRADMIKCAGTLRSKFEGLYGD